MADYAHLYEFAPVGYVTLDGDGVIHSINLTGAALLGRDRADLVGRPLAGALTLTEPWRLHDHVACSRRHAGRAHVELAGTLADGRFIELSLLSVADARGDDGWRMNTVFDEVTAAQRALRASTRLNDVAVALSASIDVDEQAAIAARCAIDFLADACAIDLAAVAGGRLRRSAFASPEAHARAALAIATHPLVAAASQRATESGEAQLVGARAGRPHRDGEWSVLAAPIAAGGAALGALVLLSSPGRPLAQADEGVARELGCRLAFAIERARLHHAACEAHRVKDEFFSVVSHELRTPLGAMLMWSQVLRATKDDPQRRARAVDAIDASARRQAKLVDDLLDVARSRSGRLQLALERVELGPLVARTIELVRPAADARGLALRIALADDAGEVSGDPRRLAQVCANLLENAIRFTRRGGEIAVSLARDADRVRLRVSDDGVGIPADELPLVFEPFRVETAARHHDGMGLGLAIAHALVLQHGGTLTATCDAGDRGAAFHVILPVLPVAAARSQTAL